jgi:hypothetical protein
LQRQFNFTIDVDISSPKLEDIMKVFLLWFPALMKSFFHQVLVEFAEQYLSTNQIQCDCCKGNSFKWKTHNGKETSFILPLGVLRLNQLQIQCKTCSHKMFITRKLLSIEPRKHLPQYTIKKLGLMGALTTYRVANKIISMFGVTLDKMNIWKAVQKLGASLAFDLDTGEAAMGEADGTGIPINGIGKRGKELKVFVQVRKTGGVRVAGVSIGNYDSQWDKLFEPLLPSLKMFKEFLLITDGDSSILKGLGGKVKVLFQRCLWHIPHQFKWYLWKDKVKHKSEEWKNALSELISIINVKSLQHDKDCINKIIDLKNIEIDHLILKCKSNNWNNCATYLENAKKDMFTSLNNRLNGKTTSHVERVMRTVNMRVNVGKWSTEGVLNAMKVRLAYYYNELDIK